MNHFLNVPATIFKIIPKATFTSSQDTEFITLDSYESVH